jgi:hypothetical protein
MKTIVNMNYQVINESEIDVLHPFLFAEADDVNKDVYVIVYFKRDSKYPYLKSIIEVEPGTFSNTGSPIKQDDVPGDLDKTRGLHILFHDQEGTMMMQDDIYLQFHIPKSKMKKGENHLFVEVDHAGGAHGGAGSIHYPPGTGG